MQIRRATKIEHLLTKRRQLTNHFRPGIAAIPLVIWCLIIFILSSIPGDKYPQVNWEYTDKIVHVGLYFWVGVFSVIFFRSRGSRHATPVLFGIAYGLSDEIHQLWVPQRTFSFVDLTADSIGIILGVTALYLYNRYYSRSDSLELYPPPETSERMEVS